MQCRVVFLLTVMVGVGLGRAEGKADQAAGSGLKSVEGKPTGGLPYRVHFSAQATAAKPQRLIVWMHPMGNSMNATVEALAPRLAARGFALLVPTEKDFRRWTSADADKLVKKTLPDLAKLRQIDAKKPILMGFSAGGQMALSLWAQDPRAWGGLILDAAVPVERKGGKFYPQRLPKKEGIKQVPFLVLVGEKDGVTPGWKVMEPDWRKAEMPFTIRYLPGRGHEWLFGGKEELALLEKWLAAVAAGELPSDRKEKK